MRDGWTISAGPEEVAPLADHGRFRFIVAGGEEARDVFVEVSGSAMASDPASLPSPVDDAVTTRGRSVLERHLNRTEPPAKLVITTTSIRVVPRDGFYEPGDSLVVREETGWEPGEFICAGDPGEAITIKDERVTGGAYQRDIGWVRLLRSGDTVARPYAELRPETPADELGED